MSLESVMLPAQPPPSLHTQNQFPYRQACLHTLFEEQTQRTPDAPALVYQAQVLSYQALNRRANQLAHRLQKLGVGPETLVGICMTRTPDLIVALLGVQKAGAAYVPLDPAYPPERIAFMLEDTRAPVLLTQQSLLPNLPPAQARSLCLDRDWDAIGGEAESNPSSSVMAQNLAYIIYTSGSTGRPKGVTITHANAAALLAWATRLFAGEHLRGVLAATSVCFDLSVYEIFLPLSVGGKILLAENALQLPALPHREDVTLVNTVPSAMAELARTHGVPASVRIVNLAGEPLRQVLVEKIYREFPHVEAVYNLYGPSEDTTYSTWACIASDDAGEPSIGRPIDNTQAYILDAGLRPTPIGEAGELYLGGDGVSRGYLNRPELTAERYLPNPFSGRPGARLYRTGDLCRYRADGQIDFLGRLDHQVKIRGFRIELGEIEAVLSHHPNIESQVVIAHTDESGEKKLVAYFTARQASSPSVRELRQHLQANLPEYMLPSLFIRLKEMPLNPNGKIDRKALPAPENAPAERQQAYVAPRNPSEATLAEIWGEVLNVATVGIHDDFFELGGHSLLATQVLTRVREKLRVNLSQRELFDAPTIAALAAVIAESGKRWSPLPAIQAADRSGHLPLSFAQQEMWFVEQYTPDTPIYNIPAVFELHGTLDADTLQRALGEIVRRHEILRTVFHQENHQPVQVILPAAPVPFEIVDLQAIPAPERDGAARRQMLEAARKPFGLHRGPLVKALLLRLAPDRHQLLLTIHHIVSDGWTTGLILQELAALYQAFGHQKTSPLPELPVQFADVAHWQHAIWQGERLQQERNFWQAHFGGELALLMLPSDRLRPPRQTFHGARINHPLPAGLIEALERAGRRTNTSLFMVMLAAFEVLLYRYTGQSDIIVCTPTASRSQREFENMAGLFVNTLPLRNDLSGEPTFEHLLEQVRQTTLEFLAHQDFPLIKIMDCLQIPHNTAYNPLLQHMFAVQNVPVDRAQLPGLNMHFTEELDNGTAKCSLSLFVEFTQELPFVVAEYNTDLFEEATIVRLLEQYQYLLESVLSDPAQPIGMLPMLPPHERRLLLADWNDTAREFPAECLHELVSLQAARTPLQTAVCFEGQALSYGELERRANQLAHALRARGIGQNQCVGICLERSPDLVVGLLGILKAGGAYLPLDPGFPAERLVYTLADSGASLLLTTQDLRTRFPGFTGTVIDPQANEIRLQPETTPHSAASAEDVAYIIYTSGSTGKPKGTLIPHRAIVNFLNSMRRQPGFEPGEILLSVTTISFDIAGLEIFLPLVAGGQVTLVSREVAGDGLQLRTALEGSGATIMQATPATWRLLLDAGWAGSPQLKILCGGEALPPDLAATLCERGASLWNLYGPTETTVWSTVMRLEKGQPVRIGRPIDNTQCFVLDAHQQPVPIGVPGELYIGGAGLAHGYLNRPELTAEKFVEHPFSPGKRLYRTGDRVRYRPDGSLEYIERMDFQVKLRGYRVELGEIESVLSQQPAVKSAVVVVHPGPGGPQLVAYFVPAKSPAPQADELRRHLRHSLPDYMIPAIFVSLDEFPLTANGKINRLALPAPEAGPSGPIEFVAPSTPFEEIAADIFREVLNAEIISIHHNFFDDLGGHSLLATQVISRIFDQFDVRLPVRTLFEAPTLAEFAPQIEQAVIARIQNMDETEKQRLLTA
ncbi:MAG: amino acid adenylation domain-containing protein [Chloroflexota bacterium]